MGVCNHHVRRYTWLHVISRRSIDVDWAKKLGNRDRFSSARCKTRRHKPDDVLYSPVCYNINSWIPVHNTTGNIFLSKKIHYKSITKNEKRVTTLACDHSCYKTFQETQADHNLDRTEYLQEQVPVEEPHKAVAPEQHSVSLFSLRWYL